MYPFACVQIRLSCVQKFWCVSLSVCLSVCLFKFTDTWPNVCVCEQTKPSVCCLDIICVCASMCECAKLLYRSEHVHKCALVCIWFLLHACSHTEYMHTHAFNYTVNTHINSSIFGLTFIHVRFYSVSSFDTVSVDVWLHVDVLIGIHILSNMFRHVHMHSFMYSFHTMSFFDILSIIVCLFIEITFFFQNSTHTFIHV